MTDPQKPPLIKFDFTINLTTIAALIGAALTVTTGWNIMDKRVLVLEEARKFQAQIDTAQDARATVATDQLTSVVVRLERQVERLNDKLDRSPPTQQRGTP